MSKLLYTTVLIHCYHIVAQWSRGNVLPKILIFFISQTGYISNIALQFWLQNVRTTWFFNLKIFIFNLLLHFIQKTYHNQILTSKPKGPGFDSRQKCIFITFVATCLFSMNLNISMKFYIRCGVVFMHNPKTFFEA